MQLDFTFKVGITQNLCPDVPSPSDIWGQAGTHGSVGSAKLRYPLTQHFGVFSLVTFLFTYILSHKEIWMKYYQYNSYNKLYIKSYFYITYMYILIYIYLYILIYIYFYIYILIYTYFYVCLFVCFTFLLYFLCFTIIT